MDYKPTEKQKEFLERSTDVVWGGAYPTRATGALTLDMLKKFIENLKIELRKDS